MATTIQQLEGEPDAYPDPELVLELSDEAAAIEPAVIWERIESHVAHRFAAREVTWVVEGPGEWVPPLTPATISAIKVWSRANEWETATLAASPLGGYQLSASGPYQFTATVGNDDDIPPTVWEAYRRLAEYMACDKAHMSGTSQESLQVGSLTLTHRRSPEWLARAMQNSGAADLLRQYRRAA